MHTIFILLGTNEGSREENLRHATDEINKNGIKITHCSSVYVSDPWGFTAQTNFLNQVIRGETHLKPEEILDMFLRTEEQMGRKRKKRIGYSSRLIDIDLLFYDNLVMKTERLILPHPRLHERRFTLLPLAEIDKDFVHPVYQKKIWKLLEECPDTGKVHVLKNNK